jgi:hypothetical protein
MNIFPYSTTDLLYICCVCNRPSQPPCHIALFIWLLAKQCLPYPSIRFVACQTMLTIPSHSFGCLTNNAYHTAPFVWLLAKQCLPYRSIRLVACQTMLTILLHSFGCLPNNAYHTAPFSWLLATHSFMSVLSVYLLMNIRPYLKPVTSTSN